ncbi:Sm domain-containing protein [Plasmodiophora brassicae]|uniref:Sm domain-containing protein n=1 Tax=Plasmodiophora brassicae TaxID=37360 RepID=A0A0G4IHZ7_PLABS|nr:hypothetical protein PBRA_003664 [Plasmodiophora brassicae]
MAALPFIGSRISLISKSDIRYEGTLFTIDPVNSTVALSNVRCFGTEGRRPEAVPPAPTVYQFIIFKGADIKNLVVCEQQDDQAPPDDPAIVGTAAPSPPVASSTSGVPPPAQPMAAPNQSLVSQMQRMNIDTGSHDQTYSGPGTVSYLQSHRFKNQSAPNASADLSGVEFDIQSSNARFDKASFVKALQSPTPPADDHKADDDTLAPAASPARTSDIAMTKKYDKSSSFFDDISLDRDERARPDENRRGRNEETFGTIAAGYSGSRYHRNGRNRRRGGGDGRDGDGNPNRTRQQQQAGAGGPQQPSSNNENRRRGGRGRRRPNQNQASANDGGASVQQDQQQGRQGRRPPRRPRPASAAESTGPAKVQAGDQLAS